MQPRLSASTTKLLRNLSRGFALVGLTALVYGCAFDKAITPTSTHPTVSINVYASGASTPAGWTCTTKGRYTICASEDPIDLTNDTDPVTIPWALIAQGWTFTSNKGIKVKGGGWHEEEVTPTQYTAYNRKDRLIYKYEISVTNGTDTVTWDPFIWNN